MGSSSNRSRANDRTRPDDAGETGSQDNRSRALCGVSRVVVLDNDDDDRQSMICMHAHVGCMYVGEREREMSCLVVRPKKKMFR